MGEQKPILDALQTSVIINRRDFPGQKAWTEWRTGLVLTGGTPAQAGDLAILGPNGKFDPSVIPGGSGGSTVFVNGVPVTDPNFNNSIPAAPTGFANVVWQVDVSGNVSAYYATGGGSSDITVFPDDTASDIPGYGILTEDPATVEQISTATVNTTGVNVPFSPENSFASSGEHGVDVIPAGTWIFDTWVSVDVTSGNAQCAAFIAVYARDTGGFETLLFSVQTPTITSTTPQLFEVSFNGSDYFINDTDRLIVKYFAVRTSGNQTRTVSFYHAGQTHLSRITAPIPSVTFVPFNAISSGTNTQATMTVDTGASIVVTGSGIVEATELATPGTPVNISTNAPTHEGMLLISQPGNTSAVWADPLVQGLYPAGSNTNSPPPFATPTTIQPVLIGGKDSGGILRSIATDANGALAVANTTQAVFLNNVIYLQYGWDTGADPVVLQPGVLTPLITIKAQSVAAKWVLLGADINTMPQICQWQVIKNGVLTGASFVNVPASFTNYDTSATAISGGYRFDSGFSTVGTRVLNYEIQFTAGDQWTLCATARTTAGTLRQVAQAAWRWAEQT